MNLTVYLNHIINYIHHSLKSESEGYKVGDSKYTEVWKKRQNEYISSLITTLDFISGYTCHTCWGEGVICKECKGTRKVQAFFGLHKDKTCTHCDDNIKKGNSIVCPACGGLGFVLPPDYEEHPEEKPFISAFKQSILRKLSDMSNIAKE